MPYPQSPAYPYAEDVLPLAATVCPKASGVSVDVTVCAAFIWLRAVPSPSYSGYSPSLRMSPLPYVYAAVVVAPCFSSRTDEPAYNRAAVCWAAGQ